MSPEKISPHVTDQPHLSKALNEVDTLLIRIARTVAPDDLMRILDMRQFHDMIFRLCDKAPGTAQGIADMIQKRLSSSREQTTGVNIRPPARKRRLSQDASYHSSKLSEARPNHLLRSSKRNKNQDCIDDEKKNTVILSADLLGEATSATTGATDATDKGQSSELTKISGIKCTTLLLPPTLNRSIARGDSIMEDVLEVAQTLYQLSEHRDDASSDIHKRIFKLFHGNHVERLSVSTGNAWSDGSIWVKVLDMGSSKQRKVTILNMLEYMGAWEWYDGQIKIAQDTVFTKKGKRVDRRGAATHVLDGIEKLEIRNEERRRWISGVGQVSLHDEAVQTPKNNSSTSGIQSLRRKQITMQLSRGQKLTTQLVRELGIGILFHRKIWEFTKMDTKILDHVIQDVKSNSCYMKLLHILGSQLECLLWNGSPYLDKFYTELQEEELLAENELEELQNTFPMQHGNLLHGKITMAIDDLIKRVRGNILAGSNPGRDDGFTVSGSVELSCDVFQRFHPGKWLDAWAILAAMHISDKPANVTYNVSIPLDEDKNNQIQQIEKPLSRWAKKIEKHKQTLGPAPLVHFCPINHRNNHFTLLELNEKEKVIRHYDSMAKPDPVKGIKETRLSKLVQEEFGSLGFSYLEAPTPQQSDNWSCGIRVVWNFRQLSNDLLIGSWDTVLSPESMALEVVNGLITCVEENTVKKCR